MPRPVPAAARWLLEFWRLPRVALVPWGGLPPGNVLPKTLLLAARAWERRRGMPRPKQPPSTRARRTTSVWGSRVAPGSIERPCRSPLGPALPLTRSRQLRRLPAGSRRWSRPCWSASPRSGKTPRARVVRVAAVASIAATRECRESPCQHAPPSTPIRRSLELVAHGKMESAAHHFSELGQRAPALFHRPTVERRHRIEQVAYVGPQRQEIGRASCRERV